MATPNDFKENAKALLKRIGHGSGVSVNAALALAAVETALREAYAKGQEEARKTTTPKAAATPQYKQDYAEECHHEWQETFLDGRAIGSKCVKCDALERDVRKQCDHFFVKTDSGEICVACRSPRVPRR